MDYTHYGKEKLNEEVSVSLKQQECDWQINGCADKTRYKCWCKYESQAVSETIKVQSGALPVPVWHRCDDEAWKHQEEATREPVS